MRVRWSGLVVSTLTALVALAVSSCSSPRLTELVVVVELGDGLAVPRDLAWLEIRADTLAGQVLRETVAFTGPDARGFPLTLGIRHPEDRGDQIDIVVNGYSTETVPSISRRVVTRFVPGERRIVHVVLERACYIIDCGRGSTCRGGLCMDPAVDPSTLPPYLGELPDAGPDLDGGMDAGDSGHTDAGTDAQAADAGTDAPHDVGIDASSDAPPDAAEDAPSCEGDAGLSGTPAGCVLTRPPARMTCGDGGDDGLTRTFALLDPIVDQTGGVWARTGFDMDGYCTDPLVPGPTFECRTPLGDPPTDGPGGVDNVLGAGVYAAIIAYFPDYQADVRAISRRGRTTILRISGWNGLPDDARVTVVGASAIDTLPAGTPLPAEGLTYDNMLPDPAWDGTDTAYVSSNAFAMGMESLPLVRDDNAYVTGGRLVMTLPPYAPIDFPARGGVGRVRLTEARLFATIAADGMSLSDIVVGGRWSYFEMLAHLDDMGICAGSSFEADAFLVGFDLMIRRALDVRTVAGSGGADVDCDAISASIPIEVGVPVVWGGVLPLEVTPGTCP